MRSIIQPPGQVLAFLHQLDSVIVLSSLGIRNLLLAIILLLAGFPCLLVFVPLELVLISACLFELYGLDESRVKVSLWG